MVGLVVNNEWNNMWKEAMVPSLKVLYWYSIGDDDDSFFLFFFFYGATTLI